jgi:hypothetical protein
MTRALYLDAATPWQVKLDDGVALSVSAPGRARGLYPLARLARVVSPASADWALPALLACLRAGVPVVFHGPHGEPVGWCFGPRRRETTLTALVREGLARPDWDARFGLWYAAAERRQVIDALDATGTRGRRLDAAAARVQLCNRHRVRLGRPAGPQLRALQRAVAALVGEQLQRHVGDAALIGWARPGLHLGQVMSGLLEWALHRLLWATPAAEIAACAPARFAAATIERHRAELHRTIGQLLGGLELHLRGSCPIAWCNSTARTG